MPSLITAGDSTNGAVIVTGGNDGALNIQTGAADAKVNAIALAADGTPTLVKGPTIGSAPTPVPSGSAPIYGARAWCLFNGTTTGTNAPLAGGNVTSVTRNGTGDYTINFTSAMPDTNYAVMASATQGASGNVGTTAGDLSSGTKTTSAIQIRTAQGSANLDAALVSVAIYR